MSGHRSLTFRGLMPSPSLSGSGKARTRGPCRIRLLGGGSFFVPLGVSQTTSRNVMADSSLIAILDPNAVANGCQTLPPESAALRAS